MDRGIEAGLLVAVVVTLGVGCGDQGDRWPPGVVDPEGQHYQYVFDEVLIPVTTAEIDYVGISIDDDENERADNGICWLFAYFYGALGPPAVYDRMAERIQRGDMLLLADLQTTSLTDAEGAGLRLLFGDNPTPTPCVDESDETCGRHLDGTGTFLIDVDSPQDSLLTGPVEDGGFRGGPGSLTIGLPLLEGDAPATLVPLIGGRLEIDTVSPTGMLGGRLGGGVVERDFDALILPGLHDTIAKRVAEDCTGSPVGCPGPDCQPCGCDAYSGGDWALAQFDSYTEPGDGTPDCLVTLDEFRDSTLISSLLTPDVDLLDCSDASNPPDDCVFDPRTDQVKDSLSFNMGFSAVKAAFPLPPSASGE